MLLLLQSHKFHKFMISGITEFDPFKPMFFKAKVGEPYISDKRSKGEREYKRVLEEYDGKRFECYRPYWLNYNGNNLELDLFNPEFGLACEYHGRQHYEYPSRFIKKKANLIKETCISLIHVKSLVYLSWLFLMYASSL